MLLSSRQRRDLCFAIDQSLIQRVIYLLSKDPSFLLITSLTVRWECMDIDLWLDSYGLLSSTKAVQPSTYSALLGVGEDTPLCPRVSSEAIHIRAFQASDYMRPVQSASLYN